MHHHIIFLPENKKTDVLDGCTLLEAASANGILIDGSCAGNGTCGKCKVIILEGEVPKPTEQEKKAFRQKELDLQYRLACQLIVHGDMTVQIPDVHGGSDRKKKMNRLPEDFQTDIFIKKQFIKVPKATLQQQTNDLTRIRTCLEMSEMTVNTGALPEIQQAISKKRGKMTVVYQNNQLLTAEAGDTTDQLYGLALDIGTTTIVAMLWDMRNGAMIDTEAATNPQSVYGADVISRIQYSMEDSQNTKYLQKKVMDCINHLLEIFAQRNAIDPHAIYEVTMVGNTTMSHLFLGICPSSMARIPFAPVFCEGIHIQAEQLGLNTNKAAQVYVLPNIAGHVGSDITAVMLATDLFAQKGNTVAIDIGTNGEILVASDGEVKACSTAAGPAFEGACIQCGMRAAKGAIEKVVIDDDVHIFMIDSEIPTGICGSGLIDAVAEMVRLGLINQNGKLMTKTEAEEAGFSEKISERLYGEKIEAGFILHRFPEEEKEDIVLTQKDIREVQLAKGAILGGMLTLMKKLGFGVEGIDRIIIAGAFGSYINKESAIRMGLLPNVDVSKVHSIGNGAGVGSAMALLSDSVKEKAEKQSRQIEHVELSQDMDFQEYYIESMLFCY